MRTNTVTLLNNQDLVNLRDKFLQSYSREEPQLPQIINDRSEYRGQPLSGLSFPLKIENGSLKLSANEDRIVEQIFEVVQTSIGERVYRQFFGMPDLIFESISEAILESRIERQLTEVIRANNITFKVKIRSMSQESVAILITYQLSNNSAQTLRFVV
jgi:phage baseplate assembly protein W